ncbi:MAG: DUF6265 family protein [Pseudomonadota bacterium]
MSRIGLTALLLSMSACQTAMPPLILEEGPSHPMVGCWESADGLSREAWTIDPSGWLFGYALDRNEDNAVLFFESMRIERVPGQRDALVVTGGRDDQTIRFTRDSVGNAVFRFVNAAHDYPQVITYSVNNGRLDAEISMLDGSNVRRFAKQSCR